MNVIDCVQGSEEWHTARLGKITGSQFSQVLNKKTGRKTYILKLAAERLTGDSPKGFVNSAMEWGTDQEQVARATYEAANDVSVLQVGFCELSDDIGVSPDGFVGENGIIEIKCPDTHTHLGIILSGKIPTAYIPQVQGILWVTGRAWCDFISYDPRMPASKYFCVRVGRDQEYVDNLQVETEKFVGELTEIVTKLNNRVPF